MRSGLSRAFTYIELVITVIIIGILASVTIPKLVAPQESVISSEGRQILMAILGAQRRYWFENNAYVGDPGLAAGTLDVDIPSSPNFNAPDALAALTSTGIVAEIQRTGGLYTLRIDGLGRIWCVDGSVTCASIKCNKGASNDRCN